MAYRKVNVKLSPCLTKYQTMKAYWGSGGIVHTFLTSATDECDWSASRPNRFTPGKEPLLPVG